VGRHVFVSYSRADRAYVEKLAAHLAAESVAVWFDHGLIAGERFDEVIRRQIDEAAVFMVVLTPAAYESRWVAREIAYAETQRKEIIPLLLEESPPFLRLVDIHHENVTGNALPGPSLVQRLRLSCGVAPASGTLAARSPYETAVPPDPWSGRAVRERIRGGEDLFRERLLGQDGAIKQIFDVLKRAALGLSGIQRRSASDHRPRAAFLFAGPAETGKMEAAALIAEVMFGDRSALLKIDMRQYSSVSQVERLVPDVLTRSVSERPGTVILFDGIERAHPAVYDLLLQILEDGRLTDSGGAAVDFSQSILVLTTNIGLTITDPASGTEVRLATLEMPYDELESVVRSGIWQFFIQQIVRPEIYNRLGSNIVVFDFITQSALHVIFDAQLRTIIRHLSEDLGIELTLSDSAHESLLEMCTGSPVPSGREVGTRLESYLVNPLARFLFDSSCPPGSRLMVTKVGQKAGGEPELAMVFR
jgi:hypothetical protein